MDTCTAAAVSSRVSGSYADFLASQGESVVTLGGVPWMKYRGALIPAAAMPVHVRVSRDEAVSALRKTGALFLRHTTGPKGTETDWWSMICRHYDFDSVSPNTRSKIRRGRNRLEIRRSSPAWLAEHGYACHVKCYERYRSASPQSHEKFLRFVRSIEGQPVFDIWTCVKGGDLVGYIVCLVEAGGVFLHTIDITPAGLSDYAAYAMIHELLEHYVNGKGMPVSNGSRSISHATQMQDFLRKFGFEREYSDLHVIYRPDVALAVGLLYPFRALLKLFSAIPLAQQVSSVLSQEEIQRRQGRVR